MHNRKNMQTAHCKRLQRTQLHKKDAAARAVRVLHCCGCRHAPQSCVKSEYDGEEHEKEGNRSLLCLYKEAGEQSTKAVEQFSSRLGRLHVNLSR